MPSAVQRATCKLDSLGERTLPTSSRSADRSPPAASTA
jgi:hypothetical protein